MSSALHPTPRAIWIGALLFAVATITISWWHWWTFQYGTFDLAFYAQALWLALRGQWQVSLLDVPLMGNHAEPIVFLLTPLFAIWPHPMLFVLVQALALASMPFTAWRIARWLEIERGPAVALSLATILTPATILVGIHEFHPEALAAPLLLLLIEAKLTARRGWFWLWFIAVLSVKENMALVMLAWSLVFTFIERQRGWAWLWRWNVLPGLLAAAWLLFCGKIIGPWLNAGNVDYLQLYSHLGRSAGEIVRNFFVAPHHALGALGRSLSGGNLLWALVLPLLALPFLRPRWWLIASPVLLQHLLSWRPSEWSIGAHYSAPLIPLFWIAAAEVFPRLRAPRPIAAAIVIACIAAQVWVGPVIAIVRETSTIAAQLEARRSKVAMLASIPPQASVMASQPYLSHLAKRERLISLHHTLKGLKTLSRSQYETPPSTDAVFIDYADATTFNAAAGYYHPRMRTTDGREVPSSDRLLHEFLRQQSWTVQSRNAATLYVRGEPVAPFDGAMDPVRFDETTTLRAVQMAGDDAQLRLRLAWEFSGERQRFPWMVLVLEDGRTLHPFLKGACAPEAGTGRWTDEWTVEFPASLPAGEYGLRAVFYDASNAIWHRKIPPEDATYVLQELDLGRRRIDPKEQP